MKRLLFCGITFLIVILSTSCDDDWEPYTNVNYDINYQLNGDIFQLSEIESELFSLVCEYDDNVKLTYAEFEFKTKNYGVAEFEFFREYKIGTKYYGVLITLYANLYTKTVYKLNYEEGRGNVVRGNISRIGRADDNAYDVYVQGMNEITPDVRNNMSYAWVIYYNDGIIFNCCDKNGAVILHSEL